MKSKVIIIVIITLLMGCGGECGQQNGPSINDKIVDWQKREYPLQQNIPEMSSGFEGHEGHVWEKLKKIMKQGPEMTYMPEEKDHWMDSEEFALGGFVGDCDDIAIYSYYLIRQAQIFADNDVAIRIVGNDDDGYHMIVVVYSTTRPIFVDNGKVRQLRNMYDEISVEFNLFAIWS